MSVWTTPPEPDAPAEPNTDRETEVAQTLARASVYRVLAMAFVCPSAPALAALTEAAERAARMASPLIATRLSALAAAARAGEPGELARAHVATLERPGGCSPYEGSYGPSPLMAGKGTALADIAGFYAAFGVTPRIAEIEDHIAAELEFMSVLALKEAAALADDRGDHLEVTRAAEAAFLHDHLGPWGGALADALSAAECLPYFRSSSALLATWLAEDMRRLGVDVAPLGGRRAGEPDETQPFSCPMAALGASA